MVEVNFTLLLLFESQNHVVIILDKSSIKSPTLISMQSYYNFW